MGEVSRPIIAIGLVLCAVFVPVAFLSGLTGEFYRQFALTIAFSTVISAINSLTLSPALSAILLKPHGAPPDRLTRWIDRGFGWLFRPFNRAFTAAPARYSSAVNRVVHRKRHCARSLRRTRRAHRGWLLQGAEGLRADPGQAVSRRLRPAAGCGDSRPHRKGHPADGRHRHETPGVENAVQFPGLSINGFVKPRTRASSSSLSSRSRSGMGRTSTA